MSVIFKDANGIQMNDFLRAYKHQIADKDILYVVQTNLNEDNFVVQKRTRNNIDGINFKIGKTEGHAYDRLKSYTNMSSNQTNIYKQSGVKVLFVKSYPKRQDNQSGQKIVALVENALKRHLTKAGRKVTDRGKEIFKMNPNDLFHVIENIDVKDGYEPKRSSDRLGTRLVWMTTDSISGKKKLHYHPEYEKIIKEFHQRYL
tara:strand:+ start:36 stop:641 length:606 start_codon:yes stop_codon:yes gene_type:complete